MADRALLVAAEDFEAFDVEPVERAFARDPYRPLAEHGTDIGNAVQSRVGNHRALR